MFVLFAHISAYTIILYLSSLISPSFLSLIFTVWNCSICIDIFKETLYFLKKKGIILNKLSMHHNII